MDFTAIKDIGLVVAVILIDLLIMLLMIFLGGWYLIKSARIDKKVTSAFLNNTMGGIIGGLVLYFFLEQQGKPFNIFYYMLAFGLSIFVIGLMSYLVQAYSFPKVINKGKKK